MRTQIKKLRLKVKERHTMAKIGLFYGSTTAGTIMAANRLRVELQQAGFQVDMHNVASYDISDMMNYDRLILAAPTWDKGRLQQHWQVVFDSFSNFDFTGKRVAFLGLGDQVNYPDNFADAIGALAEVVYLNGGQVVGHWPTDGYKFRQSAAVEDDQFVGLVLDEDNEKDMTDGRIKAWAERLRQEFAG
jgi:flavodoxin I